MEPGMEKIPRLRVGIGDVVGLTSLTSGMKIRLKLKCFSSAMLRAEIWDYLLYCRLVGI